MKQLVSDMSALLALLTQHRAISRRDNNDKTGAVSTAKRTTVVQLVATMRDGGAEAVLRGLLPLLAAEPDLNVHVVSVYDCRLDEHELATLGVPVHTIGRRSRRDLSFAPRLISTLRRLKPDILHAHIHTGKFVGRMAGLLVGVQNIVFTEHGDEAHGFVHWIMNRILNAQTSRFVVFTEDERQRYASAESIPLSRIEVIANGIAAPTLSDTASTRAELGLRTDEIAIAIPARLVPQKNQQLAVRATKLLRTTGCENLRLLLIGDGPDAEDLRSLVAELNLSDVVSFLGYRSDAKRILAACNLMALPSRWEKMPLVFGEAMLAGVPVISTPWTGANKFIEDGATGYLSTNWTVEAFAAAISRAINDPVTRSNVIANAIRSATNRYDLDLMVQRHAQLYRELVRRNHSVGSIL